MIIITKGWYQRGTSTGYELIYSDLMQINRSPYMGVNREIRFFIFILKISHDSSNYPHLSGKSIIETKYINRSIAKQILWTQTGYWQALLH